MKHKYKIREIVLNNGKKIYFAEKRRNFLGIKWYSRFSTIDIAHNGMYIRLTYGFDDIDTCRAAIEEYDGNLKLEENSHYL